MLRLDKNKKDVTSLMRLMWLEILRIWVCTGQRIWKSSTCSLYWWSWYQVAYNKWSMELVRFSCNGVNDLVVCMQTIIFWIISLQSNVNEASVVIKRLRCTVLFRLFASWWKTAEMPGHYIDITLDLAGFGVGCVRKIYNLIRKCYLGICLLVLILWYTQMDFR